MHFDDREPARSAVPRSLTEELQRIDPDDSQTQQFLRSVVSHPWRAILFSLAVNLLLFVASLSCVSICYESNDDPAMMQMASGAMLGEPTERLVFSNVLIGRALRQLYLHDPSVNWYAHYLLTVHYLASTALLFTFVRLERSWRAICAYLLLFLVFEVRLLLEFQFTSTAMIAGIAGVLLSLTDMQSTVRRPTAVMACGGVLMLLSAMIRVHAFYFAMLISMPLVVIALWERLAPVALFGHYLRRLWPLLASFAVASAAVQYDHWNYSRDPEWQTFREYQTFRATLYDFSVLQDVPNARYFFDRLGWSHNDFNMFQHYYLADDSLSNKTTLASLLTRFGRVGRNPSDAREHRRLYLDELSGYFVVTLLNVVLAVALGREARLRCLLFAALGCGILLAVFLFFSIYAKLAARVTVPAVFTLNAALMIAWLGMPRIVESRVPRATYSRRVMLPREMWQRAAFSVPFAALYGIMIYQATLLHDKLNQKNYAQQRAFAHLVNKIAADTTTGDRRPLFVVWGSEYPQRWAAPSSSGAAALMKLSTIGLGWNAHSPYFRTQLDQQGIDDIFRALYERPDIYFFGSQFDVGNLVNYVLEHHGQAIDSTPPRYYLYEQDAESRCLRIRQLFRPASAPSNRRTKGNHDSQEQEVR